MSADCVMYPDRTNLLIANTFLHIHAADAFGGESVTISVQSTRANSDVKLPKEDAIDIAERILRALAPEKLVATEAVAS